MESLELLSKINRDFVNEKVFSDIMKNNLAMMMTGTTATQAGDTENRKLSRDDFKRKDVKGMGNHYYFSYRDNPLEIEICLEPCFNGFDVAVYNNDNNLIEKKICTNLEEKIYKKDNGQNAEELENIEMRGEILERSDKAWDRAISIASKIHIRIKNEERIRRWNLVKEGEKRDSFADFPHVNPYPSMNNPAIPPPTTPQISPQPSLPTYATQLKKGLLSRFTYGNSKPPKLINLNKTQK